MSEIRSDVESIDYFRAKYAELSKEIAKVIVGQDTVVKEVLISIFSRGHCLLVGVPGLAKTLLVNTIADSLGLSFNRIQFTPDLMPSDIIGSEILDETRNFKFVKGPLFANIILADEINRTPPKTQAALLEAMQETAVTTAGTRFELEKPFFVLATQNPIDQEGTYPLPEAQLDRFFYKLLVDYPTAGELSEIVTRTTENASVQISKVLDGATLIELQQLVQQVPVASHVKDYAIRLILATHPNTETALDITNQFLRFGSSPRGAQALLLGAKVRALTEGRFNVSFDDVAVVAPPALRHRLIVNFEAEAEGVTTDIVLDKIMADVPFDADAAKVS